MFEPFKFHHLESYFSEPMRQLRSYSEVKPIKIEYNIEILSVIYLNHFFPAFFTFFDFFLSIAFARCSSSLSSIALLKDCLPDLVLGPVLGGGPDGSTSSLTFVIVSPTNSLFTILGISI